MIELFYWPTPNGHKITIFLEETGLLYEIRPIDIGAGDQFRPEFTKIAPSNRMPAIVDHAPADGDAPISIFESGAILQYLAEKTGKFLPSAPREKVAVLQWLFWQVGGLGPMAEQSDHFPLYAPEKFPTPSTALGTKSNASMACSTTNSPRPGIWAGSSPAICPSRTWPAILGSSLGRTRAGASTISQTFAVGSKRSAPALPCNAPMRSAKDFAARAPD